MSEDQLEARQLHCIPLQPCTYAGLRLRTRTAMSVRSVFLRVQKALGNSLVSESIRQRPEDNWLESSVQAKPAMLRQQNRRQRKRSAVLRVCSSSYGQREARKSLPGINTKRSTFSGIDIILIGLHNGEKQKCRGADYLIQIINKNWSDMVPPGSRSGNRPDACLLQRLKRRTSHVSNTLFRFRHASWHAKQAEFGHVQLWEGGKESRDKSRRRITVPGQKSGPIGIYLATHFFFTHHSNYYYTLKISRFSFKIC